MAALQAPWRRSLLLVAALAFTSAAASAREQLPAVDPTPSARIHIDNDLFAGRELDRDYTGGLAVSITGESARRGATLDPALKWLDARLRLAGDASSVYHARQFGLMVFTPGDIEASAPLEDDRPYANLLFLSNGRMYVDGVRQAWSTSLTLGVLGLSAASQLHNAVHDLTGSKHPRGYDHQISAGGEPTARYTLARHYLWIAHPSGALDVKATVQGSVGYLTEASAAISMRIGRYQSAWWSFAPELTDYVVGPVPAQVGRARPGSPAGEAYFFAGARLKARGYNVFLQGQFRESAVRYSSDEIEPLVGQVWVGFVTQLFEQTQLSYTLNYQTAELRHGEAAQSSLWGGVQIAHAF